MNRTTRRRRESAGVSLFGLAVAALAAWLAHGRLLDSGRAALERQAGAALALQARTVESILAKHRHLPAQLAHRDDVRLLFGMAPDSAKARGESIANDVAGLSGAADIAFVDPGGAILAAARERIGESERSFVTRMLAGPLEGRLGRTVVPTDEAGAAPGYVFSYPVRDETGAIVGAALVMVDLGRIEDIWALSLDAVRATDGAGRVVVANDNGPTVTESGVAVAKLLPQVGWRLEVVRDARSVRAAARTGAGFAALGVLAITGLILAWLWRRHALAARQRRERANALVLERRVRDRTRELDAAQLELVQTAKLAALGRMSAALAHEYAQPLAAIRTYAENAATLVAQDRAPEVPRALDRVVAMADRMRALSRTLRSFAREPGSTVRAVSLGEAVGDAVTLAQADAKRRGITIAVDGAGEIDVMGGRVRLSQICLNLLTNAIEASPEGGTVRVRIEAFDDEAVLHVADDGPGVPAAMREQVFEPFFTTRPVGEGLGLGLAIAYNIARDFGATLRLLPSGKEGGATFELRLRRAETVVHAEAAQ